MVEEKRVLIIIGGIEPCVTTERDRVSEHFISVKSIIPPQDLLCGELDISKCVDLIECDQKEIQMKDSWYLDSLVKKVHPLIIIAIAYSSYYIFAVLLNRLINSGTL